MSSQLDRTLNYGILVAFSIIALFPLVSILSVALETPNELTGQFSVPHHFHWSTLEYAWNYGHFALYLRSSVIVTVSVVAAVTILSILSGYAFGTMRFRGDKLLFYLFILGLIVPGEAVIIPLYYDLRAMSLTDTYWSLILPEIAGSLAFGTYWMRAFFRSTPRSLLEAARIDGASSWQALWHILVPLGRPAVVTMMVLTFMWSWNEFLLPLVMISNESLRTAPLGLAFFQSQHTTDVNGLAAGCVIISFPVVLMYIVLQRHFIRGVLSGAIKG